MKIYTDASVRPSHLPLVPLLQALGCPRNEHDDWWERHAPGGEAAVAAAHRLVDDPSAADVVVIPLDWYWVRGPSWATIPNRALARRLAEVAAVGTERRLPVVVFFSGDLSCERVSVPGTIVLREAGYQSSAGHLDRPMPAFVDDLAEVHLGRMTVIDRPERPTVGFCGLARRRTSAGDRCRELAALAMTLVHHHRPLPSPLTGENLRWRLLEQLSADPGIETDFVIRSTSVYFGQQAAPLVREEFVANLAANAYSLCIRGSGNYSYRLYETMAMGRIPVIVDTDLTLPRSDVVPWDEITVRVPEEGSDLLGEAIADFHDRLGRTEFVELQHTIRDLWLDHLRPQAWLAELEAALALPVSGTRS